MINLFNRRELLVTNSLAQFNDCVNILVQNNINYKYVSIDRQSPSPFSAGDRARTGSYGQDRSLAIEYKIYVHKNDFELSNVLMQNVLSKNNF